MNQAWKRRNAHINFLFEEEKKRKRRTYKFIDFNAIWDFMKQKLSLNRHSCKACNFSHQNHLNPSHNIRQAIASLLQVLKFYSKGTWIQSFCSFFLSLSLTCSMSLQKYVIQFLIAISQWNYFVKTFRMLAECSGAREWKIRRKREMMFVLRDLKYTKAWDQNGVRWGSSHDRIWEWNYVVCLCVCVSVSILFANKRNDCMQLTSDFYSSGNRSRSTHIVFPIVPT